MTLINTLNIARKAIDVNEQKLEATSNNISNINTPGYHKKRIITSSAYYRNIKAGFGGVKVNGFQRYENNFLLGNLLHSIADESGAMERSSILGRLEEIVGEPNGPITSSLDELFNAFNDLSINPTGNVEQQAVVHSTDRLISNFRTVDNQLVNLKTDTFDSLGRHIEQGNQLLGQVSKFNKMIRNDDNASNIPDQLENVLTELSTYMKFDAKWLKDGTVSITSGGQFIANKQSSVSLRIGSAENNAIEIINERTGKAIDLQDGIIVAKLDAYNVHISGARDTLDQLTSDIISSINYHHSRGISESGSSGGDFFDAAKITANTISLRDDIRENPSLIAASLDGSTAAAIASIPEESNITEILEKKVFDIALIRNGFNADVQRFASEKNAVETRFRSEVGVDLSEEMMNMVKEQRAYAASAQVFNAVKDMLDVLIQLGK